MIKYEFSSVLQVYIHLLFFNLCQIKVLISFCTCDFDFVDQGDLMKKRHIDYSILITSPSADIKQLWL